MTDTGSVSQPSSSALAPSRSILGVAAVLLWVVVLGAVGGVACVAARLTFRGMQWVFVQRSTLLPAAAARLSESRRFLTPILGGALATLLIWAVRRWSRATHFEEYVEAVRLRGGRIPFMSTFWRTLSSGFSVATGAAVGREGSMIQFATATTSFVGEHSRINSLSLSRQVACGAAAAVAAAYQAPIAGAFFALEIVLAEWQMTNLLLLLVASFSGWALSRMILGGGPLFAIHEPLIYSPQIVWAVPLAIALGLVGPLYQKMLRLLRFTRQWTAPLVWSSVVVGALSMLQPTVWGNGDGALLQALQTHIAPITVAVILGLRLTATSCCIGAGTVGGVFTPTLFAGAAIGFMAGHLFHCDEPVFLALIGLSAFLASVTHAPFMAAFMAIELTGKWHALPLVLILDVVAARVSGSLSSMSLYAIASETPDDEHLALADDANQPALELPAS